MLAPAERRKLGAAARAQLHGVNRGTDRDVAQRQVVARLDVGTFAGLHLAALPEPIGSDDVALLAVDEVQQRDSGGAVRVVLYVRDLGRHAVLVVALEVDQSIGLLVAATDVPRRDLAAVVPAASLRAGHQQRLLRSGAGQLDEVGHARAAAPWRRRLVLADSHVVRSSFVCVSRPAPRRCRSARRRPRSRSRAWCRGASRSRGASGAPCLAG